jgi:hypothetical protein
MTKTFKSTEHSSLSFANVSYTEKALTLCHGGVGDCIISLALSRLRTDRFRANKHFLAYCMCLFLNLFHTGEMMQSHLCPLNSSFHSIASNCIEERTFTLNKAFGKTQLTVKVVKNRYELTVTVPVKMWDI